MRDFLMNREVNKDNIDRFITWMHWFNSMPSDSADWPLYIQYTLDNFNRKKDLYSLESPLARTVIGDVKRSCDLFVSMARYMKIPEQFMDEPCFHITRIIVICLSERPQYEYTQGFDRYACVLYALALNYAISLDQGQDEAEPFAIELLSHFIELSELANKFNGTDDVCQFVAVVDQFLLYHNKKIISVLTNSGYSSIHFVSPWTGVMFADIHTPEEILLLWDSILLHSNSFQQYILCLVSAHIDQIEMATDPCQLLTSIQNHRVWDIQRVLTRAEQVFNEKASLKWSLASLTSFWL